RYSLSRTVPAPSPAKSAGAPRASAPSALRYRIRKILALPRLYTDRTGTRTDRTVGSLHDPAPVPPHARPCSPSLARSLGKNSARRVHATRKKILSTSYSSCRNTSSGHARHLAGKKDLLETAPERLPSAGLSGWHRPGARRHQSCRSPLRVQTAAPGVPATISLGRPARFLRFRREITCLDVRAQTAHAA